MKILLKEKDQGLLSECKKLLKENPNIKKRRLHLISDLEKRLYYIKVWVITESQPLHVLRNYDKRCFRGKDCYHLDHIVPISHGFYSKIPPEKIGGMSNLRFIKSERNMRKGHKLTTESHRVLRKIKRRI
jgi:5-methylcytosine-specific restriction endonuclease McrA